MAMVTTLSILCLFVFHACVYLCDVAWVRAGRGGVRCAVSCWVVLCCVVRCCVVRCCVGLCCFVSGWVALCCAAFDCLFSQPTRAWFVPPPQAVSALAFSPDGCFLYSGGEDAMVSAWNMLAAVDPEGGDGFKVPD